MEANSNISTLIAHTVFVRHHTSDIIVSEGVRLTCQWILFTILCLFTDLFGIVANIINIICFVKQGFKDPVNISLLGLAVADLGCLTTLLWTNICYTPAFSDLDLSFDAIDVQYLTTGMLHATFTRVTAWITAIITLERCLCITAPLKVKSIITSKRVAVVIISIFVILLSSVAPWYVVNRLGIKFVPRRNTTILGLVHTDYRENVEKISFGINNIFVPFAAFIVVTICTAILATKLQRLSTWRKKVTTSVQIDGVSNRNLKVAKMVVMISSLFIACFIPLSIIFIAAVIEPEISMYGKYRNFVIVCVGCSFVLESINSSVNIFIYYRMSSKYKSILHDMFSLRKR